MSTGWTRATTILTTAAIAACGALSVGCGLSPAYEPEPRTPSGYMQPEPATSTELAAQTEANEVAGAESAGEVVVGGDSDEYADTDPSALTEFKPALDGHGAWVDDATYGTVWVPAETEVGTDFVPYTTAGHWTYDDGPRSEWVWVSDYGWGWAPFHYGRWVHVSQHGWAWIPGRTYSGAWVSWRAGRGYDYVGWAPLGPSWYWHNGTAVGWTFGHSPSYSYCHRDYVYRPGLSGHVVRGPAGSIHEGRTQAFVPANPQLRGGGRAMAAPTVGVGVGGGGDGFRDGRRAATPSVGGRVVASPQVGPRPVDFGIRAESVVSPPADHAGLARAKLFALPSTAVSSLGAAPPVGEPRRYSNPPTVVATSMPPRAFAPGSSSSSRLEAVARTPQYPLIRPVPPRPAAIESRPLSRSFSTAAPPIASPGESFRSQPAIAATPQPQYRPTPNVQPALVVPIFRPSPSAAMTPQFRASPSVSTPSPTVRSLPSSATIRSSPSAPSFRSTPIRVAPPPSSPALARPSVRGRR